MNDLEIYEAVNGASSLKELADIIRKLGGEHGIIEGRSSSFDSEAMADYCEDFFDHSDNVLTRKYGIRQQAIMLLKQGGID